MRSQYVAQAFIEGDSFQVYVIWYNSSSNSVQHGPSYEFFHTFKRNCLCVVVLNNNVWY